MYGSLPSESSFSFMYHDSPFSVCHVQTSTSSQCLRKRGLAHATCCSSLVLFVRVYRRRAECSAVMGASSQRDELSQPLPPSLLSVPSQTPILQSHSSGWQAECLLSPPQLQLVRLGFCCLISKQRVKQVQAFKSPVPWIECE